MATKKQKRAAALAKRERFMAEVRRSGLEAQRIDQEKRERRKALKQEQEYAELEKKEKARREAERGSDLDDAIDLTRDESSLEMECI